MAESKPPADTLAQLDPLYFLDYTLFTGAVRHYAALVLEKAFKEGGQKDHLRRLHLVNLLKEEYAAYEDAGAILNAFLEYRDGKVDVPFASLIAFSPTKVELGALFETHKIKSGDDLFDRLKLDAWIPSKWAEWFKHLDLRKALHLACNFFFEDCVRNQKRYGVIAYNKIKHGLILVPSGRLYLKGLPDAPAMIFLTPEEDRKKGATPQTIIGFPSDDAQILQRHTSIEFVQCNLRLFTGLYVTSRYPESLAARGIADPREMFARPECEDVMHLIDEVTKKK